LRGTTSKGVVIHRTDDKILFSLYKSFGGPNVLSASVAIGEKVGIDSDTYTFDIATDVFEASKDLPNIYDEYTVLGQVYGFTPWYITESIDAIFFQFALYNTDDPNDSSSVWVYFRETQMFKRVGALTLADPEPPQGGYFVTDYPLPIIKLHGEDLELWVKMAAQMTAAAVAAVDVQFRLDCYPLVCNSEAKAYYCKALGIENSVLLS
jgi:hypothetical protein